MQPITRETVVDRRQPAIRWSAVLAGAVVAVGLWGVLQVLGIGAGLAALDPDDATSAHGAALGTGAWSIIAPLIAMFVGGYVSAKLANTYDRRVAGAHAAVMWGVTAVAGLMFTLFMISHAALGTSRAGHHMGMEHMGMEHMGMEHKGMEQMGMEGREGAQVGVINDAQTEARDALVPINNRLRLAGKPQISPDQLIAAVRNSIDDGKVDREELQKAIAEQTALSKDESAVVATELGSRIDTIAARATRSSPAEHDVMNAAETAGKGLLAFGLAILVGIATAMLGAMLALRRFDRKDDERGGRVVRTDVREGETVHTTAPYPTTTTPTTPTTPTGV